MAMGMAIKISSLVFFFLLLSANLNLQLTYARRAFSKERFGQSHQCQNLDRISVSRPARRIGSEGGTTELWNENEQQLQCAGLAAMRNTIRPNSLSLPNYSPTPTLLYVQRGRGLLGLSFPGCPESFISAQQTQTRPRREQHKEEEEEEEAEDRHQRIRRVFAGMVVALPGGVMHWCHNDGNEDLVAFYITDFRSETNQLDEIPRSFYLAGGESKRGRRGEIIAGGIPSENNILRGFDSEMLSKSLNVPREVVEKMQRDDRRGLIVKVKEGQMRMTRPPTQTTRRESQEQEEEEEYGRRSSRRMGRDQLVDGYYNGVEETFCNAKVEYYLDNPSEADVYSRDAGQLNSVNVFKLPILGYLQLSAEKGRLKSNAMFGPHWNVNAQVLIYFTRGEGKMEIVSEEGKAVFEGEVREGDVLVLPQLYASMAKAREEGLEWVSFKSSGMTMRSNVAGRESIFRELPSDVISNSFQISSREALRLKNSRRHHLDLFPSSSSSN